ncbi:MAG: formate--tetrahydrofolate ligase [Chloroflexi bacterium]|nr:formate--tetrahydrofolate ligase [Chloroflexota bacterium]
MPTPTDTFTPQPITEIASRLGLQTDEFNSYGPLMGKVRTQVLERLADKPDGKLILVTAISPTSAGEGKTTVTVGLAQTLYSLGKNALSCTREPSLGPVFGIKGGATGGGKATLEPSLEINLHFTGDFHAITAAHNLLAAMLDNHLHQGNKLGIDPRRVTWRRTIDMNDRALRNMVIGLGGRTEGVPRESGFDITPASEIMAILCLSSDLADLKERLGRIVVGETFDRKPVTAADLNAHSAMTVLMREAVHPNLVQNMAGGPALVHGGPFGNIAHGCNSIIATRVGLKLADYVVTEAGFGTDLGAEKFFNIKCRRAGLAPSAVVLVATIRALKLHGGVRPADLETENTAALAAGLANLQKHIENIKKFGLDVVVALNRFPSDTANEMRTVTEFCKAEGVPVADTDVFAGGIDGGKALAEEVLNLVEGAKPNTFKLLYPDDMPLKDKIATVAREIYGAARVNYAPPTTTVLRQLERRGFKHLPICMAKTQSSFSDNPRLMGRPEGFTITVREVKLAAGAGFVIPLTGDILTLPGLPAEPAADGMTIDEAGNVSGLT